MIVPAAADVTSNISVRFVESFTFMGARLLHRFGRARRTKMGMSVRSLYFGYVP